MCASHLNRAGWRLCLQCASIALAVIVAGCEGGRSEYGQVHIAGGDPERGARVIREFGCGACHSIPGIDGAQGTVGPPLTRWAKRSFIAGYLPNKPGHLMSWLMDAPSIQPTTAMPDLDLTAEEARDVAAYLYTIN